MWDIGHKRLLTSLFTRQREVKPEGVRDSFEYNHDTERFVIRIRSS